jgi:hypothetical protein
MATKTKRRAEPNQQERLLEYTTSRGASLRVNRDAGRISGVKILGLQSANNREYTRDAARNARGLYEGIAVNVDHVEGKQQRSYRDRVGKLTQIEIREDGIYGDLLVNQKHALAEQLFWDAENSPGSVGLSHDVTGKTKRRGAKTVVESIDVVRSVDLVAEPASTAGLFESVDNHPEEKTPMDETTLKEATVDQLKKDRPDLFENIKQGQGCRNRRPESQAQGGGRKAGAGRAPREGRGRAKGSQARRAGRRVPWRSRGRAGRSQTQGAHRRSQGVGRGGRPGQTHRQAQERLLGGGRGR